MDVLKHVGASQASVVKISLPDLFVQSSPFSDDYLDVLLHLLPAYLCR